MGFDINRATIVGRMGQDPELKHLPSGDAVTNFSVATDESYRDRNSGEMVDKAEWHRVTVFGKTAEFVANHCGKGSRVYVEGPMQTRKWTDQEGNDRWSTEVKAQRVINLCPIKSGDQGKDSPPPSQAAPAPQSNTMPDVEEVPF